MEQQICKNGKKNSSSGNGGNCNGHNVASNWTTADAGLLAALVGSGEGKWPLINGASSAAAKEDGTKTVASDIVAMSKDEKTIVAGHLAKSIEGGGLR